MPAPHSDPADLAAIMEASTVSIAIDEALRDAGLNLPQFAVATTDDYLIRLGSCNVQVGMALCNLIRDGLTLRDKYPEESINVQS
ncbi:hypothetical protein [Streptomyces prunicolor]|uniref:hypothetical protein n=1 Tax=Streptomyces prunicolor TaxID=67348 RepID=UPI0034139B72